MAARSTRGPADTVIDPNEPPMALEQILERLAHVVDRLEKGDLPLEQSLAMFEEGVKLTREGQRRLDSAEERIEALLATDSVNGEPRTQVVAPAVTPSNQR